MKVKFNGETLKFNPKQLYEASVLAKTTAHKEMTKEEFNQHFYECLSTVIKGGKNA